MRRGRSGRGKQGKKKEGQGNGRDVRGRIMGRAAVCIFTFSLD